MMVQISSHIVVQVRHEEYDVIIQGEPKSLIKFCIHPDSYRQISRVWHPESCNEDVKSREDLEEEIVDDLYVPITGNFIQIERDMLWNNNSSFYDIFYDNVIYDVYAAPSYRHDSDDELTDYILSKSREIIAKIDTNKSVVISTEISGFVVSWIEKEDIMKYLDTRLKHCGEEEEEEESSSSCAICLEEFTTAAGGSKSSSMIVMPCSRSHQFHQDCITQWLRRSYLCPICRSDQMMESVIDHYLSY